MNLNLQAEDQFGNYKLVRPLGSGGFAQVWLGKHTLIARESAIKILQTQLVEDKEREDFLNEAGNIARLEHPNIVRLIECDIHPTRNIPYLVLAYASNGTLRQRHPRGSRVSLATILPYVTQSAAGLQYAHDRRLVHRDVKPANLLLGPGDEVWLGDFGIAQAAQSTEYQKSIHEIVGTPEYMAPEQFTSRAVAASDQYALATVVYEWLTGVLPFTGDLIALSTKKQGKAPSLRTLVPEIPVAVDQAILKALSPKLGDRFRNVQEFADALEQAAQPSNEAKPREQENEGIKSATGLSAVPDNSSVLPMHNNTPPGRKVPPTPLPEVHTPPSQVVVHPLQEAMGEESMMHVPLLSIDELQAKNKKNEVKKTPPPQEDIPFVPLHRENGPSASPPQGNIPPTPVQGAENVPPPPLINGTPAWNIPTPQEPPSFYNDPTHRPPPQEKALPHQPVILPSTSPGTFGPGSIRRQPHIPITPSTFGQQQSKGRRWFDRQLLSRREQKPFLIWGLPVDALVAVSLFFWLRDPNIPLLSFCAAVIVRFLCAIAMRRSIALPLSWLLILYWGLGSIAFFLGYLKTNFYALAVPVLLVAWFLHDFQYARKKPKK